jgi:hypothetical protein
MTGVPACGLPKMTSLVSRSASWAAAASPLWSMTVNRFIPLAATIADSRSTVSPTDHGLSFVTTPGVVLPRAASVMSSALSLGRRQPVVHARQSSRTQGPLERRAARDRFSS